VARVIGAIGDESAVPELKRRIGQPPPAVERNIRLALARLGQQPFLEEYAAQFQSEDWKIRLQALQDFEYVNRPELVRHAAPLLLDTTPVGNIGAPPAVEIVRICDIAVVVIAKVAKLSLSFDVRHQRIFTDREIQEVRAHVARL
jgi:HEAT repeat protein